MKYGEAKVPHHSSQHYMAHYGNGRYPPNRNFTGAQSLQQL